MRRKITGLITHEEASVAEKKKLKIKNNVQFFLCFYMSVMHPSLALPTNFRNFPRAPVTCIFTTAGGFFSHSLRLDSNSDGVRFTLRRRVLASMSIWSPVRIRAMGPPT